MIIRYLHGLFIGTRLERFSIICTFEADYFIFTIKKCQIKGTIVSLCRWFTTDDISFRCIRELQPFVGCSRGNAFHFFVHKTSFQSNEEVTPFIFHLVHDTQKCSLTSDRTTRPRQLKRVLAWRPRHLKFESKIN